MKIPDSVLTEFEKEAAGLNFGEVNLTLFLRDGHSRFEISRRRTLPPDVKSVDPDSLYKDDNTIDGKQHTVFRKKGKK
jgi:hypothetical protein